MFISDGTASKQDCCGCIMSAVVELYLQLTSLISLVVAASTFKTLKSPL